MCKARSVGGGVGRSVVEGERLIGVKIFFIFVFWVLKIFFC